MATVSLVPAQKRQVRFPLIRRLGMPLMLLMLLPSQDIQSAQGTPPQVILRVGHDASVSQALFSPDGRTVATLGADAAVNLWDARTGTRRAHWQPEDIYPNTIAFAPDGSLLAVGGLTGTIGEMKGVVALLDPDTGATRKALPVTPTGQDDLSAFAWSPDAKTLAIARRTGPVVLWDVATASPRTTLSPETTGASAVAFSTDGGVVIARFDAPPRSRLGADPPAAKAPLAWDARTGAPATVPARPQPPADLAVLAVLAAGPAGRLALGDLERQDVTFRGRLMPHLRVISTTPVFWDPTTGKSARGEKVAGPLTGVQWSGDGSRVAAAHRDAVLLFNPATGATEATLPTGRLTTALALSPDGGSVAVGEEDGTVVVFSTSSALAGHTPVWLAAGRTTQVQAVALSPDATLAVSAHADGTIALWDLHTGRLVRALTLPGFKLVTLAWSPDSRTLATSQARQGLTVTMADAGVPPADLRLWDMPGLTLRKVIPGTDPRYPWNALAFSPDGSLLAGVHSAGGMHLRGTAGDSDPAVLWDARTGEVKQSLDGNFADPRAIAFAPAGGPLAISDDNTFSVYDPPTFAVRPIAAPSAGGFTALAFSRDGRTLITGDAGGRVRFWAMGGTTQELREGRYGLDPKTHLPSGDALISGLSLSPDGVTVASGGWDKTVRLWTVVTGALAATLPAQEARITAVRFTPSGLLVTGGADGTIRIWDPEARALRATLALLPPAAPRPVPPPGAPVANADGAAPPPPVPLDATWMTWTQTGYYEASTGAGAFADWQQDGKRLPPDERRARWNRPAQIEAALTAAPKP